MLSDKFKQPYFQLPNFYRRYKLLFSLFSVKLRRKLRYNGIYKTSCGKLETCPRTQSRKYSYVPVEKSLRCGFRCFLNTDIKAYVVHYIVYPAYHVFNDTGKAYQLLLIYSYSPSFIPSAKANGISDLNLFKE